MERSVADWEKYLYPGTDVLINKLDIRDPELLSQTDIELSFAKLLELHLHPIEGNFDAEHLRNIHHFIFGELYDWAGEYRDVDMLKNGRFPFAFCKNIESTLNSVLAEMHEALKTLDDNHQKRAYFLADYFYELFHVHPFREGNSRTTREFIRELVLKYMPGFNLDWSRVNEVEYNTALNNAFLGKGMLQMIFLKH